MNERAAKLTALSIASLSSFVSPFMLSSINIALPVIGEEFKIDAVLLSWVAASYLLAALINYSATFAVALLLSLYLQYIKELNPQEAGLILVSTPVVMALLSPFAGRLSDRVEPRVISSLGMGLTALGLIFLNSQTVLIYIIASLIIIGFGFALFSSPNMNAIMGSVDKRFYGIASASVGTMRLLGQMVSMGMVTLIFALFIGRVQITAQYYPMLINSIRVVFIISFCLCVCGIFFSLCRGRMRPGD
jgi:MFS family permease